MVVLIESSSFHPSSLTMSSTKQDPRDSILLILLGEVIMGEVIEACIFTLIYGAHPNPHFLDVFNQCSTQVYLYSCFPRPL